MSRLPIMPNAENCSLEEINTAIRAAASVRSAQRMTAIRALLVGFSRRDVCAIFGRLAKTLRDWISRFNGQGVDRLARRFLLGGAQLRLPRQAKDPA